MFSGSKHNPIAAVLAVGLCAIGVAWVLEPAFAPSSELIRLAVLGSGVAVAIGSYLFANMRTHRESTESRNYFESLTRIDPTVETPEAIVDSFPEFPAGHPMGEGFAKL